MDEREFSKVSFGVHRYVEHLQTAGCYICRVGNICELKGRQGRRIAGGSEFLTISPCC
jgi:hypothetical protein